MDKMKLYDAAKIGDMATLQAEDPNLVSEVSFARSRNLLHIAAMYGQESIVEVLKVHGQLARDLDSQNLTALHIAAAQESVEVASKLLLLAPETLWWRDCHGLNPVHIAAIHGPVDILAMLLQSNLSPAIERVHRGESVLHLCVKHDQRKALKFLVDKLGEFLCAKDDDGETILHLAVRCKQLKTIQYLVDHTKIEKQARNSLGKTALQILTDIPHTSEYSEMEKLLKIPSTQKISKVFPNMTDTTMVVVGLIATMAFQVAITPPPPAPRGGVWQESKASHKAGDAVMASTHPKLYQQFVRANTTAFVSSIITTRQPSGRILFLLISLFAMWVSLASISLSYGASIMVISPNTETQSLVLIIIIVVVVSLGLVGFIFGYNIIREWCLYRTSDHHTSLKRLKKSTDALFSRIALVVRRSETSASSQA